MSGLLMPMHTGTVSVLPEWWSPATQTAYDPAAVHQRRMSRHRRWARVKDKLMMCVTILPRIWPMTLQQCISGTEGEGGLG